MQDEWEQDWENAQIDAEDTIVSIEALVSEAEGWATDLEGYGGLESEAEGWATDLEGDEGAAIGCAASGPSDADSGRDCLSAVGAALAETLGAIAGYLTALAGLGLGLALAMPALLALRLRS